MGIIDRKRTLPIDTNIRRVLGRIFLGKPFPTPADDRAIETLAMKHFPNRGQYFDVPQALFDIASLYCKKVPNCAGCPLRNSCKAAPKFLSGRVRIPKRSMKKANEKIRTGKKYPDRIYRGRILQLVKDKRTIPLSQIGAVIDPHFKSNDAAWLEAMISRMVKDGLIERKKNKVCLPEA